MSKFNQYLEAVKGGNRGGNRGAAGIMDDMTDEFHAVYSKSPMSDEEHGESGFEPIIDHDDANEAVFDFIMDPAFNKKFEKIYDKYEKQYPDFKFSWIQDPNENEKKTIYIQNRKWKNKKIAANTKMEREFGGPSY